MRRCEDLHAKRQGTCMLKRHNFRRTADYTSWQASYQFQIALHKLDEADVRFCARDRTKGPSTWLAKVNDKYGQSKGCRNGLNRLTQLRHSRCDRRRTGVLEAHRVLRATLQVPRALAGS